MKKKYLVIIIILFQIQVTILARAETLEYPATIGYGRVVKQDDFVISGIGLILKPESELRYFSLKYGFIDYNKSLAPPKVIVSMKIIQIPNNYMEYENSSNYDNLSVNIFEEDYLEVSLTEEKTYTSQIILHVNYTYQFSINQKLFNFQDYIGTYLSYKITVNLRIASTEQELNPTFLSTDFSVYYVVVSAGILYKYNHKKKESK